MASSSKAASIGRLAEIAQVAVKHGFGYLLDGRRAPDDERDDPRPAPPRDARRARADVRQARAAPLDAPGHRPAGHHRRAARPPGRRASRSRSPRSNGSIARGLQPADRRLFLEFEEAAGRRGVDRAGAPRRASERPTASRSRCSARTRRARSRATSSCSSRRRGSSGSASGRFDFIDTREIVDEFARSIRQELDYRQEGRNAQVFHRNFAAHPHVAVPRDVLELHEPPRADARVPGRRPARRPRARRLDDRAAARASPT